MSSTLANMVGVFGAGLTGWNRGVEQGEANARRKRDEEFEEKRRKRMEEQWQREDRKREDIATAASPLEVEPNMVKPETMDNRDVGQPGETLNQDGYRVGSDRFKDRPSADAAATSGNTGGARSIRMADALRRHGDLAGARQERTGQLQLEEAERKHVEQMFDDSLNDVQTPDQLAAIVSNSALGGALKLQAVPAPDGRTFIFVQVNPDGTKVPASNPFANTPSGLMEAKLSLSKVVPINQKLDYVHKAAQLKIAQQQADTDASYKGALGTAAGVRADKAGANVVDRMSEVDKLTLQNLNRNNQAIEEAVIKAQADGTWSEDSPNAKQLRTRQAALGLQARQLLARYSEEETPDPLGLRGKPAAAAPAPATRAPTSMETVMQDLAKPGAPQRARIQLSGQPVVEIGAPAPPPSAPAAPAAAQPQDAAGAALDAATQRRTQAQAAVQKFGSRQRQQNPQGFHAAQAELEAAVAAEQAAQAEYQRLTPQMAPSFRMPKP